MSVIDIHRRPVVAVVSRAWTCGGDLYHDGRPLDFDDAADLIIIWRGQALIHAVTHQRLADGFTRAADDLEGALTEARQWRRCWKAVGVLRSPEGPEDLIA